METDQKIKRCSWSGSDETYIAYHDQEWGVPVVDDHTMFTFLVLESFQAGLSWITILKRRDNFRRAFSNFDVHAIAGYTENDVDRLMHDSGIIRNQQKIRATINNAQRMLEVRQEFGTFCDYWWQWVDYIPIQSQLSEMKEYQATTPLSDAISKDLKKRGFKFVGSTTMYAHMQAAGLVNDHLTSCIRYAEIAAMGNQDIRKLIRGANEVK